MEFKGVFTALVTPFDDNYSVDWKALEGILEKQAEAGVSGVVVTATTGEAPTLSLEEKIKIVELARKKLGSNIRVMAGSGGNCTESSVSLSKRLQDAGADSLLVVTPYYNKPSLQGLIQHFQAISDSVSVPICLYHVPGRTGVRLSAEGISKICEVQRVDAVKEASGDISLFLKARLCCEGLGKKVSFLSGDDFTYLASLAVGGQGCISVVSNLYPSLMVKMSKAMSEGKLEEAIRYNDLLYPICEAMFCETNPTPVKAALSCKGLCKNVVRLPLAKVSSEHFEYIKKTCSKLEDR